MNGQEKSVKPVVVIDKGLAAAIKFLKKMPTTPGGFVATLSWDGNGTKKTGGIFEVRRKSLLDAYYLMIMLEDLIPAGSFDDKVIRFLSVTDGWVSAKVLYGANGFQEMSKDTLRDRLKVMVDQGLLEREKTGGLFKYRVPSSIRDLFALVDEALKSEMSQAMAAASN